MAAGSDESPASHRRIQPAQKLGARLSGEEGDGTGASERAAASMCRASASSIHRIGLELRIGLLPHRPPLAMGRQYKVKVTGRL